MLAIQVTVMDKCFLLVVALTAKMHRTIPTDKSILISKHVPAVAAGMTTTMAFVCGYKAK